MAVVFAADDTKMTMRKTEKSPYCGWLRTVEYPLLCSKLRTVAMLLFCNANFINTMSRRGRFCGDDSGEKNRESALHLDRDKEDGDDNGADNKRWGMF